MAQNATVFWFLGHSRVLAEGRDGLSVLEGDAVDCAMTILRNTMGERIQKGLLRTEHGVIRRGAQTCDERPVGLDYCDLVIAPRGGLI